jgi:Uracil DNA glycosylase superfamily
MVSYRLAKTMRHTAAITSLEGLREPEAACTRCPLYRNATQAVPGEGPVGAALMMVGEQPGDQEDLAGRPFVGPAGRLLDRAIAEAGIDRSAIFVPMRSSTSSSSRGKRRMHKKPNADGSSAAGGGTVSNVGSCIPRWWWHSGRQVIPFRADLKIMLAAQPVDFRQASIPCLRW